MILLTGGTGLVGAHLLVELTKSDEKIRAIYRTKKSIEKVKNIFAFYDEKTAANFSKIEWSQADITDVPSMILAFEDVKKVYHCAALVSFDSKDYIEMRKTNIHGTAIIANLSIDKNIKKLCFVGSIASVGNPINNQKITEEDEWNDQDHNSGYAITKYGAEMEIWRASQEGVQVIIVNPGVILGSGFWQSGTGQIFTNIQRGFKYFTEGITGFVGVKDVVKAMILLMESNIKNERFILVSENKSFKNIFYAIADAFQVKRPKINIKPWQTSVLWRVNWLVAKITQKSPKITKYWASAIHSVSEYSSEKIKKSIAFEFQKIAQVIEDICLDFKK